MAPVARGTYDMDCTLWRGAGMFTGTRWNEPTSVFDQDIHQGRVVIMAFEGVDPAPGLLQVPAGYGAMVFGLPGEVEDAVMGCTAAVGTLWQRYEGWMTLFEGVLR